ncbi:metalloproteinase inhibitor 2 [Magallana gigas]|uniref:metalloproteinase inhibitor 2 n=1 Tax=Magallana gigas TaxID=29159 RepID=UPI0033409F10
MAYRHLLCAVLVLGLFYGPTVGEDPTVDDCGCFTKHPQEKFCSSEAAFKGRALSVFTLSAAPAIRIRPLLIRDPSSVFRKRRSFLLPSPQLSDQQPMTRKTMKYKFHVDEVFKGDILPDSEINVDVHEYMAGCSSLFSINQTYLVTGELDAHGVVHNGVCDWSGCWNSDVSLYQKISLKSGGYSCDVKICHHDSECPGDTDTCVWPKGAVGTCFARHAKCHMSAKFKKAVWTAFPSRIDSCLQNIPVAKYHE